MNFDYVNTGRKLQLLYRNYKTRTEINRFDFFSEIIFAVSFIPHFERLTEAVSLRVGVKAEQRTFLMMFFTLRTVHQIILDLLN
jgi:hypothetical protein